MVNAAAIAVLFMRLDPFSMPRKSLAYRGKDNTRHPRPQVSRGRWEIVKWEKNKKRGA
jgi:hypothetical protein